MLMFWPGASFLTIGIQLDHHPQSLLSWRLSWSSGVFSLTNRCHNFWPDTHPTLKITNMNEIEQNPGMVQTRIMSKLPGRLQLIFITQNHLSQETSIKLRAPNYYKYLTPNLRQCIKQPMYINLGMMNHTQISHMIPLSLSSFLLYVSMDSTVSKLLSTFSHEQQKLNERWTKH
jgi:hypothetical protein